MHKVQRIAAFMVSVLLLMPLAACQKSEEAQAVDEMILAIGEVNSDSSEAIANAEEAYQLLNDKDKNDLENYAVLQDAREEFDSLQAQQVEAAIQEIGVVDGESKDRIKSARKLYNALNDTQKELVKNYNELVNAEEEYASSQIKAVEEIIDSIGEITLSPECKTAIEEAEAAYKALDSDLKMDVINYSKLQSARTEYDSICPVSLNGYKMTKNIIGGPEISFNMTNITDEIIKSFVVRVFAYDNDGVPVKVSFNNFTALLEDTNALRAGKTSSTDGSWTLYGTYSEMRQIVAYVEEVEFFDGTTWENPNSTTFYMRYNECMLEDNDENVLKRY